MPEEVEEVGERNAMEDGRKSFEDGPTYKLLFIGACGVIFAFIGWWATDLEQSVSRTHALIGQHETRVAELEAATREYKFRLYRQDEELKRLGAVTDAHNKAFSEVERSIMLLERGKGK